MKKMLLKLFVISLLVVQVIIGTHVNAVGPDPSKPYILITPFLSSTSMRNGQTLAIKANVNSNFDITRGYAQIEGFNFQIPMTLKAGTNKSGFWIGTWVGTGLVDKIYQVNVTFFDSTGHSWTDRSQAFSDPISGIDTIGDDTVGQRLQNHIIAQKISINEHIDYINAVKLYSKSAQGVFRAALYNSERQLIWQSGLIQNTYHEEWVELPISQGTPRELHDLSSGDYYLAIQSVFAEDVFAFEYDKQSELSMQRYLFNAFPSVFNTNDKISYKLSGYVIYNEPYRFVKRIISSFLSLFD